MMVGDTTLSIEKKLGMGLNFMLIDDDEMDLITSRESIEREMENSEILAFREAKRALAYLRTIAENQELDFVIDPDIIMLDSGISGMNVLDFLDDLQNPIYGNIKIPKVFILSSNKENTIDNKTIKHSHFGGFIDKPLTYNKIHKVVRDLGLPNNDCKLNLEN